MHLLTGYAKPITALALSADGTRLFSAARGQQMIWVWDLAQRKVERKLRGLHTRYGIGALATAPSGDWLVSADNSTAVFSWRLPEGERRRNWYCHGQRKALAFHPHNRLVAGPYVGSSGKSRYGFQLIDPETGKLVRSVQGHTDGVADLAFSADGKMLATGSTDRTVRVWDVDTGELLHDWPHKLLPGKLAFHPDGQVLAVTAGRSVLLWAIPAATLTHTLTAHEGPVSALAYSPDGRYLASAGADGVVALHDAQSHDPAGRRHLDVGKLGPLVWRPDSSGL